MWLKAAEKTSLAPLFCCDVARSVMYLLKHHLEMFAKPFLCNGQEKNVASLVHGSHDTSALRLHTCVYWQLIVILYEQTWTT